MGLLSSRFSLPPLGRNLFLLVTFSSASELGERLRFSSPALLVSKPFQSYYRRAREGRSVQLDENLFVETMAAMRTDIVGETKSLQSSMMEDSSKAISMKAVVKQTSLARGFLRRGFLNWSVQPTLLPKVLVASSSTLVAKEVGVEGTPSLLGGCCSPNVGNDEDSGFNGLI
jgi:hypothetical protein